ncbi:MAG: hypothetical protein R2789_02510 [Microthrixaceae bacterium]
MARTAIDSNAGGFMNASLAYSCTRTWAASTRCCACTANSAAFSTFSLAAPIARWAIAHLSYWWSRAAFAAAT